jgi:hypothetical protein
MRVSEEVVIEVVTEASKNMSEANYSAVLVGGFVQGQPQVAQYLSSFADEMGGPEGVVNAIFHSALLGMCFKRGNNRDVAGISFDELNRSATDDRSEILEKKQPAIHEYIVQNVEDDGMKKALFLIALAMDWSY